MPSRQYRFLWALLIPALLIMFWLVARRLDVFAIWSDELYMLRDAQSYNDPFGIAQHLASQNPWHTPAYFIMMNIWANLAGWNPFPARALALFMALFAVAWTYRIGRDWLSPRTGLYAALILASSELFIHYSHELRMYTLTAALMALFLWLYLRLILSTRPPSRGQYAALFTVVLVMLYTHYFLSLGLAAVGLYHLFVVRKDRRWWTITGTVALAGLLFLPWMRTVLKVLGMASDYDNNRLMTGPEVVGWVSYLFSNGQSILFAILVALTLYALSRSTGRTRQALFALVFSAAVIALLAVIVTLVLPIFAPQRARYLIFVFPLLALLAGVGITQVGQVASANRTTAARVSGLVLAVWLAVALWNNAQFTLTAELPSSRLTFPIHVVMRELRDRHFPGDFIVDMIPDDNPLVRYGNNERFYVRLVGLAADTRAVGLEPTDELQTRLYESVMSQIGEGRDHVWVAYRTDPLPAPLSEFTPYLEQSYGLCGTVVTRPDYNLHIDEYARSPVCCTPESVDRPPTIDYGNRLALMGVDLHPQENGQLLAFVAWRGADALPPDKYSVALHVVNEAGELVAQADGGLPADDFICEREPIALPSLPAGEYELRAIVYDWQTGERLTGTLTADGAQGDALPVSQFTVSDDGELTALD